MCFPFFINTRVSYFRQLIHVKIIGSSRICILKGNIAGYAFDNNIVVLVFFKMLFEFFKIFYRCIVYKIYEIYLHK